jgi:hypothetical protein
VIGGTVVSCNALRLSSSSLGRPEKEGSLSKATGSTLVVNGRMIFLEGKRGKGDWKGKKTGGKEERERNFSIHTIFLNL